MAIDFNTRVSVKKGNLDMIGDSLRVHFGELKEEGTKSYYEGNGTQILKTPNMNSFAIYGIDEPVSELFDDHDWVPEANWDPSQPLISTIKVHGAASLKIKMSYVDASEIYTQCYTWLGEGLHAHASDIQGEYLPHFHVNMTVVDKIAAGLGKGYCASCGAEMVAYVSSLDGETYYTVEHEQYCKGYNNPGSVDFSYTGWNAPTIERTFSGDTFTLLWHVGRAPGANIGHYIELQAFDADGNLMKNYFYTVNQVINEWAPGAFSYQIDKLNNYPNAEEVKF
jgi:hypothetical protein